MKINKFFLLKDKLFKKIEFILYLVFGSIDYSKPVKPYKREEERVKAEENAKKN